MQYNGIDFDTYYKNYPDKNGYFGKYGGVYISDELKEAMKEINDAYDAIMNSRKGSGKNNNYRFCQAKKCKFTNVCIKDT